MEKIISIENINKSYGENIIFNDFKINFYENKVNCILGKSGSGKTTLLNIISGVTKNDTNNFKGIENLGISYIFQDDRLIDWLTVEENIKLVVKKYYKEKEIDELCKKYLKLVDIYEYKDYYPQMLSGGIRQRVNIARAFIYPSKIIIMDEPFKSIDVKNKLMIMEKFKNILKKDNRTVLFVTHDIDEALYLGDKVFVLGDRPLKIKRVFEEIKDIDKEKISKYI
ncbi:MAG: ABC transporter ATP-binding protein [Romboutsia sp.]|nr:ABC transporter ATP-binding protein [Romboutsia sp.]